MLLNVDLDGVVYPFTKAIRYKAAAYLQNPDLINTPPSEGWELWETLGITKEQWDEVMEWATLNHVFDMGFKPYPDAAETLHKLYDLGHHIRIVTAKPIVGRHRTEAMSDALHWLRKHEIPFHSIVFDSDKSGYPCDIAIDDKPNTINWMTGRVDNYLFDQTWNRNTNVRNEGLRWRRVSGWREAFDRVLGTPR